MKNIVFLFIFLLVCLSLNAQDKRVYEGTFSYILHSTGKGETIYSLTKNYSVSQEMLLRYNPFLSKGLKVGQQLKIPVSGEVKFSGVKGNVTYSFYRTGNNETLKKIAGYFSLDESDLLMCNPNLSHDILSVNQVVRIPDRKIAELTSLNEKSQPFYNTISHRVARKETLYSISRKYDCSVLDILKLNPKVKDKKRLRKGVILKIPISVVPENVQKDKKVVLPEIKKTDESILFKSDNLNFGEYLIKRGETFYSISKKFFVTVNGLKNFNPGIKMNDLVPGEMIKIPKNSLNKNMFYQDYENSQKSFNNNRKPVPDYDHDAAFKTYRIGLMIPLFLSENKKLNSEVQRDSITENILVSDDSLVSNTPADSVAIKKEYKFYSGTKSFLNFYEGVLLAVDSLKNAGMNVELYTFDTEQKKEVIDSLLNLEKFKSLDLVIGPVFPDLQREVAAFAKENHIAFISPLSSAGNLEENNPYYFKVNPEKKYFIQKTTNYMIQKCFGKNIIFLKMGEYNYLQESAIIDKVKEKYRDPFYTYAKEEQPDFHEYLYPLGGLDGLREIMRTDKQNVVFISFRTEGQLSEAITNLNTMTKEGFNVTLVGLSDYQRYKSIQTEYFYNTNMNYLSSYFIDYKSSTVNGFIRKFRQNFSAEPDNFSFQGYDVAFYFMSALLKYGHDFIPHISSVKVELLQDNFNFIKHTEFGGYINEGLFLVKYTPDYMENGIPYVEN